MEDVTRYHALTYPKLYIVCQKSKHLKWGNFLMIFWKSLFQSVCVFLMAVLLFDESFLKVVTISFSALVGTELINIITLVDRLNKWIISANLISLVAYVVSCVFFREVLGLQIIDVPTFLKILLVIFCCVAPFEIIKRVNRCCWPSISDKIMLTVMKKDKNVGTKDSDYNSGLLTPPDQEL